MFKEVKNNKLFLGLLSGASLIIWGMVVWQMINGVPSDDEPLIVPTQRNILAEPGTVAADSFLNDVKGIRNPFQPYFPPKKTPQSKVPVKTESTVRAVLPSFEYVGFLKGENGSLAVLAFPEGDTRICATGDEIQGMRLVRIEREKVTLFAIENKAEIILSR